MGSGSDQNSETNLESLKETSPGDEMGGIPCFSSGYGFNWQNEVNLEMGFWPKFENLTGKLVKLRGLRVNREDMGGGLMKLEELGEEQGQMDGGKAGILVVNDIANA